LVFQHVPLEPLGTLNRQFKDAGFRIRYVNFDREPDARVDLARYHGLVVLGGPMAADQTDRYTHLGYEMSVIHRAVELGLPVLGICLGAQLIARSFDADLHIGGDLEFGFHTVAPTPAAAEDPVLGHLDGPLRLFQWHTDHYALPPGAVRLATGETYDNQAYRVGRTVYGMQFHFEVTGTVVRNWIDATPELEERVPGYRDWLPGQFEAHEKASHIFCRNVTRRWIALA
jgi:GMP synthase (glutamine-hydrolysing)